MMTKKEKAEMAALKTRVVRAESVEEKVKEIARLFVDLVKDDLEGIARDAAGEIADDLTIIH